MYLPSTVYKSLPYVYLAIAGIGFSLEHDSIVANLSVPSGIILVIFSMLIIMMRRSYQKRQKVLNRRNEHYRNTKQQEVTWWNHSTYRK